MAVPYLQFERDGSSGATMYTYRTYSDWGLIPDGRLIVNPPEGQENYIEIPGRNGEIDISENLTGSAVLKNRTGSWEFYIVPNGYAFTGRNNNTMAGVTPAQRAQVIYNALHGKKIRVWLGDDLTRYYTGRVKVKSWAPGKTYSKIVIDYNLAPGLISGVPSGPRDDQGGEPTPTPTPTPTPVPSSMEFYLERDSDLIYSITGDVEVEFMIDANGDMLTNATSGYEIDANGDMIQL